MIRQTLLLTFSAFGLAQFASADEPSPVPLTRTDMKKALENSKSVMPRLPLPPLTEEEKAKAEQAAKARLEEATKRGDAAEANLARRFGGGVVNNGRMRSIYLSEYNTGNNNNGSRRGGMTRASDSGLTYPFQTELFWIVSRSNNCTYCMGHQESKLATAGLSDDQIAALDGSWSNFSDKERAAFAFAKKLTYDPHQISDSDIAALRKHYNDAEITDIIVAVSGFNATNRWTGPLRITQETRHEFLKPTSPAYASVLSQVAPVPSEKTGSGFAPPKVRERPALESPAQVEAALEAARHRTARLPLADESATKGLLNGTLGDQEPKEWMRLLAKLPNAGPSRVASYLAAEQKGTVDARTKAIIAYVAARHDRAWYALGHARKRLKAAGLSDEQVLALDHPEKLESPADRELVPFARTIAVDPAQVTDGQFEKMRALFGDKKVAEIVYQATQAAFFDRLTEAAGLRLED